MANFSFTDPDCNSVKQLFRYALVGTTINIAGYLVYLLITFLGVTPKIAVTFLYIAGASVGFWGNRKLAFMHQGSLLGSGVRYIIAHIFGYLLNLAILILFVDMLGYAHQWVQAFAVFVVAGYLFLAFKFFVFPNLSKSCADNL
jgi:putative flippase GtrA